jgi:protein-tyrosine phosphatase
MKTVLWIEEANPSRLAIVLRPRGDEGLQADLELVREAGIDVLVSLLTADDNEDLGLASEGKIAEQLGMKFIAYPILDRCTPSDLASFHALVANLRDQVRDGKRVGAHCRGCIGRATVLIASVMIALGWDASQALQKIERARGFPVPDTPEQLEWILHFHPGP